MEANPLYKKYQPINDQLVLFNDEYYLSVMKFELAALSADEREQLFNRLFEFQSADVEVGIDVSEEAKGTWYLQLLVPHFLTLPEAAVRRMESGADQLAPLLGIDRSALEHNLLHGEEIYEYVKRYNPDLQRVS